MANGESQTGPKLISWRSNRALEIQGQRGRMLVVAVVQRKKGATTNGAACKNAADQADVLKEGLRVITANLPCDSRDFNEPRTSGLLGRPFRLSLKFAMAFPTFPISIYFTPNPV